MGEYCIAKHCGARRKRAAHIVMHGRSKYGKPEQRHQYKSDQYEGAKNSSSAHGATIPQATLFEMLFVTECIKVIKRMYF